MRLATPGTIWISGLSASGKTTLSSGLTEALQGAGVSNIVLLDGELFRARLNRRYGHSLEERFAVAERLAEETKQECLAGNAVVVATISHRQAMREHAREINERFYEIYLDCPADVCAARDNKGHYRRARAGEYDCFIGVTEAYEPPTTADLVIDTATTRPQASLQQLLHAAQSFLELDAILTTNLSRQICETSSTAPTTG